MNTAQNNRFLYPDGNVNMNKISNLTDTFAAALVQGVWEHSGHGENAVHNLFEKLERLNSTGYEAEVIEMVKTKSNPHTRVWTIGLKMQKSLMKQ